MLSEERTWLAKHGEDDGPVYDLEEVVKPLSQLPTVPLLAVRHDSRSIDDVEIPGV